MKYYLTMNEQFVVDLLRKESTWRSPTAIGNFKASHLYSLWASSICKRLVDKRIIERNKNGYYRIKK